LFVVVPVGGGASALVAVWVGAEDALQLVEAQADEGDLRRVGVAPFEEALLAQGGLPGRRRAGGGLLEVADSAARRRPAGGVAVVLGWGWERRGAGGREGGGGGLVELGRRRHAQLSSCRLLSWGTVLGRGS
jgi:hypothetical protein